MTEQTFYTTDRIREKGADVNIVVGERSNGKSTAVLLDILRDWVENGNRGVLLRQLVVDIQGSRGQNVVNFIVSAGLVSEITGGEWSGIDYYSRAFYLTKIDGEGKKERQSEPFLYAIALSESAHYKSNQFPGVRTILFDEFIPETGSYMPDEFARFQSLLSTIVRGRGDTVVFLVANTVSWNSPYLRKYYPEGIEKMSPGELNVTEYKKIRPSGVEIALRVAVEYCESSAKSGGKASDKYFIIDDARAAMITDGKFAIPEYPKCPIQWNTRNVKARLWIRTDDDKVLSGKLIRVDRHVFLFVEGVEPEAIRLADPRKDLFYSMEYSADLSHFICPALAYASDPRTQMIAGLINSSRVFFDRITTGEDFTYYVNTSAQFGIPNL